MPTCWRHSKLCIIAPGATGLRDVGNTLPRWKLHEHDNKYLATNDTCGIPTIEDILIMKPNADQPKTPESKPGSKPKAKDDLQPLSLSQPRKGWQSIVISVPRSRCGLAGQSELKRE